MKSPTLGICPLTCFPKISPWLSIITAVLWRVYLFFYLSSMDETITTLCFFASFLKNWVDYPSYGSENSTHGYFSLVHIKNGAVQTSWRQTKFAFYIAASYIISPILFIIAFFWSGTEASVGRTILFWIAAILTLLGYLVSSFSAFSLNCLIYTFAF